MKKTKIKVCTEFDNKHECNEFMALKDDDVIKYIDLENNKMIIDIKNNIIIRENNDYLFNIDLNKNIIEIEIKKLKKYLNKEIKTILVEKKKKSFLVRYMLIDDNKYNEYYVTY